MDTNNGFQNNQQATLSLIFGLATILSFCVGAMPIPFTGYICFPLSFISGMLALIFGIVALNQIRRRNESGKPMAWVGIVIGGIVFMCLVCMAISLAALFIFAPNYVPTPPFLDGYQL
jgi:zinc transporter ZupT